MTRLILAPAAILAIILAGPASAQHQGHNMPGMTMPMPSPAVKKQPAKKAAAKAGTKAKAKAKTKTRKAVSRKKPVRQSPAKAPVKAIEAQPDPHSTHDMSQMGVDGHSGHGAEVAGTDLPAGNAPPPPVPTDHVADAVYGAGAMEMGRRHLNHHHGGQTVSTMFVDRAEARFRKGRDGFAWEGGGWTGGDIDRLWIKTEGEGQFGGPVERAEVQALYSHAIGPYFNLQAGARYDFRPNPSRLFATVGVEGLAPYFFDLGGALFLSNKGELLARAEASYDQRITQRLILQPRVELNFSAQDIPDLAIRSGLSDVEAGLRLRYEIRRTLAPYVGIEYSKTFGDRDENEEQSGWSALTGVQFRF